MKPKINRRYAPYLRIFGIALICIAFYVFLNNLGNARSVLDNVLSVFTPITIGLCFAFVFNIPLRFLELTVFGKLTKKNGKIWKILKRPLCLVLSVLMIFGVITVFIIAILPRAREIGKNILNIVTNLQVYINEAALMTDSLSQKIDVDLTPIKEAILKINGASISEWIFNMLSSGNGNLAQGAFNTVVGAFNAIVDTVLGFALAMYILSSKEAIGKLFKSAVYAIFSRERAKSIISVVQLSNKAFTGFVSGQCLEVVVIGSLCFVGMLIFGFPEALLVSSIIAVTAFIPIFGPFIGTAIGAIIIFINGIPNDIPIKESFTTAILFVVFIIVLQQIESNLVYPRIMGNQVGLPGVWVLVAVTLGGGFFGIAGIILSVPICSVFYTLLNGWLVKRLKQKNICHNSMEANAAEPKKLIEEIGDYDLPPDENIFASSETKNAETKKSKKHKADKEETDLQATNNTNDTPTEEKTESEK